MEYERTVAYKCPQLVKEWHPTKNGDLKPTDVTAGAHKRVWWKCKEGHEWLTTVNHRSRGNKCPYCSGRLPIVGETDLATKNPQLALEWHPTKNGDLKPTDVTVWSNKKVWWVCKNGHEWQARINSRSKGSGCPYCSRKLPITGETDLLTVNPQLASEWHPTKNGDLKPADVTMGSVKKVWWRCKKGHEWQATIGNRGRGKGCPYCTKQLPIVGETDLSTKNPQLASEWHPTKNGDLKPIDVTVGSGKKVWWKCKEGHEWQAVVNHRNRGSKCPYCAGKLPIVGETDLLTVNPQLASEWHPVKNRNLKSTDVTVGSGKKVWWKCKNGHEWKAVIGSRNDGASCPHCEKER